ncbi:malto-oligosyltrehalose trehalohydrolase [Paenarthrobacter sp. Y-19]|uniref:malto-oligosyltrehalose trehalohydrolase n=1 Tax=Paenarthrobacter sp. Y-19 TaxID=3031125 RepID=UPI001E7CB8C3|nr:malto-oligosyltrehalose trehalohydrolase [Paenarthrobacter sp. Y-19]BCW11562.1 malto-oligosyltrehalose trehalohydrolase [Arthrobacter sp. NtRootA2]BCW15646.1 malto-oligosyltrehalose trehalohydrolase [Arthrobacter sp. NtRootA4]BCW23980.1 malto-oligosyltrehalose trehalohydrolase [Arthrobacter sp. NtRootC7]BCW28248.1 malto-oligosyltrehalose trehalohydrolase [Arthrobacter sp. NtRootC45]BCW32518.1 malto-oligosyltrehalose trehalohydrolase [Arthrobacter sp. NtRootD5]
MLKHAAGKNLFDVWAPNAKTVRLVAGGHEYGMEQYDDAAAHGWWHAPAEAVAGGVDGVPYGYLVDGEGPFPDPRSRRQPDGVHGLSSTFDPSIHEWKDAGWKGRNLKGSVIYELHLGTFTPEGTLDAAAGKLDYLVDLGVDFIELLPVNGFNGVHNWGYDGVLWYAVHEPYGGPAAYQRFVDAAHAAGLGVIQDVVYNHLGPSGNYLPKYGPYLKSGEGNTWGDSVNLDGPGSDDVRRYILENAAMWLRDYHVDGLRLDAVHALRDERAVHILEDFGALADQIESETGIPKTLIAESDLNNPRLIYPRKDNGYGLEGQWSDDFHHAVHVNLSGETTGYYSDFESLSVLAKVLEHGFFHDGSYSSFRGRHHGRSIRHDLAHPSALVVCLQNHDQIGNRAIGDRLTATLSYGKLAIGAVLTMTSPFTPMLFMGEEFGASTPWQFFTSHPEPDLGKATAEGRIKEFERMGWDPAVVPDPQDPQTFERSKLKWEEAGEGDHARLLQLYRDLAQLRRNTPELVDGGFGDTSVEFDDEEQWLQMSRGKIRVVCNFGDDALVTALEGSLLLSTDSEAALDEDTLTLPGASAAVVRVN